MMRRKIKRKLSQVRVIINHQLLQNRQYWFIPGPVIQRSVAFDLSDDEEKPSEKRVTISKVTINDRDCDNKDSANQSDKNDRSGRKDSTALKKEIIGILKPPNPKKELKSFPSLPECFLHDLGLIENIALK